MDYTEAWTDLVENFQTIEVALAPAPRPAQIG